MNVRVECVFTIMIISSFLCSIFCFTDCLQCDLVFPKCLEASQSFDNQVEFGKIDDVKFSRELGVKLFPNLGYFEVGNDELQM